MLNRLFDAVYDAFIAPIWNIAKVLIIIGFIIAILFVLLGDEVEGIAKLGTIIVMILAMYAIFFAVPIILKVFGTFVVLLVFAIFIAIVDSW